MGVVGKIGGRRAVMALGFAAALCGDWLLAVKCSPVASAGFLGGVVAFACAHLLWAAAHLRTARPSLCAFIFAAPPLAVFSAVRIAPTMPNATAVAVVVYAIVTAFDFAVAVATRRRLYVWGVALLALSDIMIGMHIAHVPGCGSLIGPLYVSAELCLLASCVRRDGFGTSWSAVSAGTIAAWTAFGALTSFTLAMAAHPGGYNPLCQMLSVLGRTHIRMVEYPWSHYLFMLGMAISAVGIARIAAALPSIPRFSDRAHGAFRIGAVLNAAGLASIALIPENVCMDFHNAGCWLATAGGAVMLASSTRRRLSDAAWLVCLFGAVLALGGALLLHAIGLTPFSPGVPTAQKVVILSFMVWVASITLTSWTRRTMCLAAILAAVWLATALPLLLRSLGR